MHPIEKYEKTILEIFRMDLQLHFFWGFFLTLLALFYEPLILSGLVITLLKESLDVMANKGWSWGDVIWGVAGCGAGIIFLSANELLGCA